MPDWKVAIREWLASADLDPLLETEIVEELAQHLEERHEELGRSGITPEECRRRVLEEIKDRDSLIRTAPGTRKPASPAAEIGIPATRKGYFRGVLHDLRVGCRNLRTRPFFSFTVIGMLALGIAGNAAIFSIFDGLFLGPLPFAESQRLVDLDETAPKWDLPYVGISSVDLDE